ncbi:MAG: PLDc N-terminal domain-containing protein [Sedimentisphaerales bacterium]|nr:PLDc N-terminal domain-containing protein [Sedimentisphaerales bacterium]
MLKLILIPIWFSIFIGLFALWIWTLIDCIKNESTEGNERIVWVVVIATTHWIGALIYLIVRRPQRKILLGR